MSVETENTEKKYRRQKNTGRILRAKEQWIPITLPDKLRIIDKHIFDLAQKQLSINAQLSPRNTKNEYLLRGLIKCGSCDSPYHGVPYHGKLFYRCGNRHRTFPLPKECKASIISCKKIEGIVWSKFCELINNPKILNDQILRLIDKISNSGSNLDKEIDKITKKLGGLTKEETRVADAYREGIFNIEQLKEQMGTINEKKISLEAEKSAMLIKMEQSKSSGLLKKSIAEYCKELSEKLRNINNDFEGKKHLLSLAVNSIIVQGNTIRIKGILPIHSDNSDSNIAFTSSS